MADPGSPAAPEGREEPNNRLKLDPDLAGAMCYLFLCLSGLVFFLLETENKRVRFHAMQSLVLFSIVGLIQVASLLLSVFANPFLLWDFIKTFVFIFGFILWLTMVIQTSRGRTIRLPFIGDAAARTVGWKG